MRTRRQHFGQHFLKDPGTVQRILQLTEKELQRINPDAILEVGPGRLAITRGLSEIAKKHQLPLILVEKDHRLETLIKEELHSNAELKMRDAASDEFLQLLDELKRKGMKKILFVSNLPYSASSQILANLCARKDFVPAAVVMIQKELAQRMVAPAKGKERGSFSLLMQSYYDCLMEFHVPPGAFAPPPKVMSTVLTLHAKNPSPVDSLQNKDGFENFCKSLFSGRRKMIRNLVPEELISHFASLGLKGIERPETLELETIIELYKIISKD